MSPASASRSRLLPLLFQASLTSATASATGDARRVLFVTAEPLQTLPTKVHGMPEARPDGLGSFLRFVYPRPKTRELLHYVSALGGVEDDLDLPEVLVVHGLEAFVRDDAEGDGEGDEEADAEHVGPRPPTLTRLLTALHDLACAVARRKGRQAQIVLGYSAHHDFPHGQLEKLHFWLDEIWTLNESSADNRTVSLTCISSAPVVRANYLVGNVGADVGLGGRRGPGQQMLFPKSIQILRE